MPSLEDTGTGTSAAIAPARAALAGNPSDGYGGAVLAVAFPDRHASARAQREDDLRIEPENRLVRASAERLARNIDPRVLGSAIRWETTIPRSVGLGGSSAIVIAVIRALLKLHGLELAPVELAQLALAVEVDDLGVAAGLQDRITQAHGGLMFMDFGAEQRFERLRADRLPPLVVAWRDDAGGDSGVVHGDLRERYERADAVARESLVELAALAHRARDAVLAEDGDDLARCADASFDARARMIELDPRHVEMIELARSVGAGANYAGSGGAVVCVCRDRAHQLVTIETLRQAGCGTLAPMVS